jgi:capsid protein
VLASLKVFRRRVGAFIGGFEAGLANRRLKGFQPSRAHLNTLIAAAGPDITARARWLVRNNGYARAAAWIVGAERWTEAMWHNLEQEVGVCVPKT